MDFLETFTSVKYHKDMNNLEILASNFKGFRFYGILKNEKLMMIEGGGAANHYIFLDNFCLR